MQKAISFYIHNNSPQRNARWRLTQFTDPYRFDAYRKKNKHLKHLGRIIVDTIELELLSII